MKNKLFNLLTSTIVTASLTTVTMPLISCSKALELDDVIDGFNPKYDKCTKTSLDYESINNEYFAFAKQNIEYINQEYKHYIGIKAQVLKNSIEFGKLKSYKTKLVDFKINDEVKHTVSYKINKEIVFEFELNETVTEIKITNIITVNNLELNVFVSNVAKGNNLLEWFVSPSALNCDFTSNNWSFEYLTKIHKTVYFNKQQIDGNDQENSFILNKNSVDVSKEDLKLIPMLAGWSSYYLEPVSFDGSIVSRITSESAYNFGYNFAHIKSGQPLTFQFNLDKPYKLTDFLTPTLIGYRNINGYYQPIAINPSLTIVKQEMISDNCLEIQFDWNRIIRPEYEHISHLADIFNVVLATKDWTYVSQDFIPIEKSHAYDNSSERVGRYAILDCNGGNSAEIKIDIDDYLANFFKKELKTGCQNCSISLKVNSAGSVNPQLSSWNVIYDETTLKPVLLLDVMMDTAETIEPSFESNPFDISIYYNNKETNDENLIILPDYKLRYGQAEGLEYIGSSKYINFKNNEPQLLMFKLDEQLKLEDIKVSCLNNSIVAKVMSLQDKILTISIQCKNMGIYKNSRIQVTINNEKKYICPGFTFNNLNDDVVSYTGNNNFYFNVNQETNIIRLPINNVKNGRADAFKISLTGDLANYFDISNVYSDAYETREFNSKSYLQIILENKPNVEAGKTYSGQINITYEDEAFKLETYDLNIIVEDCPYYLETDSLKPCYIVVDGDKSPISIVDVDKQFTSSVSDLKLTDMNGKTLDYELTSQVFERNESKYLGFYAKGKIDDKLIVNPNCQLEFKIDGNTYHLNNINIDRVNYHIEKEENVDWNISLSSLYKTKLISKKLMLYDEGITFKPDMFKVTLLDNNDNEISGITITPTIDTSEDSNWLSLEFKPTDEATAVDYKTGKIHISYYPSSTEIWQYDIPTSVQYVNDVPFDFEFKNEYDYKDKHELGDYYEVTSIINANDFDINRLSFNVEIIELTQEELAAGWYEPDMFIQFVISNNKMYLYNLQPELQTDDKIMAHYKLTFKYIDNFGNVVWTFDKLVTAKCNLRD